MTYTQSKTPLTVCLSTVHAATVQTIYEVTSSSCYAPVFDLYILNMTLTILTGSNQLASEMFVSCNPLMSSIPPSLPGF